ncbi:uncharacterized protein LOC114351827 [Ostrinia furnacalis]|uniref:uncharacterized protein LOC114351827 n=1 Tax=Ostrinia furnacalis TaxID=93504 RepID=UPI00104090CC|nr:uncharacterized protein LOC114351827 [Ostrinia furnacalis]
MFMQSHDATPGALEEEFSRPVESIMRIEDFKSNFARRLSNRYTTKSPVATPRTDTALKLRPDKSNSNDNVSERIEPYSQLSKSVVEQNGEAAKPPDKPTLKTNMRCTEVTALNMEVETLRWQLAQTEANRQMHIALLKQIVTFLNRVRDHIDHQKNESTRKESMSTRIPKSFNVADLPRSRSVLHVNKNLEYLTPTKKISTRKISKSISNVNGFRDASGVWNQSKLSLISENESSNKISEEMSRLITLANTVLSTKLPDLACSCNGNLDDGNKFADSIEKGEAKVNELNTSLSLVEENSTNAFILNTVCDDKDVYDSIINKFMEVKDHSMNDFIVSPSPLTCGLENDFAGVELNEKERQGPLSVKNVAELTNGKILRGCNDKRNEYSHVSNFIEDESGFSSMNSFQEIGIPIISIIPPSPCKEVGYMEEMPDILSEHEKWKTDTLELDKQTMKVFWV